MTEVLLSEQQEALLAGYVLGDLSPAESLVLQQMLADNPSLQKELNALQLSLDRVYGVTAEPPAHLKGHLLSKVASPAVSSSVEMLAAGDSDGWLRSRQMVRWMVGGLGAIAAGWIGLLSVQNYTLRQAVRSLQRDLTAARSTEQAPSTGSALNVVLKPAAPDEPADTPTRELINAQIDLVIDPDALSGVLTAEGLPPLESDQVYVLWTVVQPDVPVTTDEKGAILTTVFTVDAAGRRRQPIVLPSVFEEVSRVKALAVTIESAAAPQEHQSSPILIQPLSHL